MQLSSLELWLFEKIISQATDPAAKAWCLGELKALEAGTSNPYLKVVVHGLEKFLELGS